MHNIMMSLKQMIIFSYQDLMRIKGSIANSYAHLSAADRAEILSFAIHNHLDKHLLGINDPERADIRLDIIKNTLGKHIYDITKKDVFDSITTLDLSKEALLPLLEDWLEKNAGYIASKDFLDAYLNGREMEPLSNRTEIAAINSKYTLFRNMYIAAALLVAFILTLIVWRPFSVPQILDTAVYLQLPGITDDYLGLCSLDRVYLLDFSDPLNPVRETLPFGLGTHNNIGTFGFEHFHYFNVKHYIAKNRNGLIANPEYFNRIIHLAYLNDVDPLLLFAIIGQEQAFVNREAIESSLVINNPFNVFHSWQDYNTTLRDSTKIAINTIKIRMSKKPTDISPIYWLGEVYAEDPEWHVGVSLIYLHLKTIGGL